LFNNQWLTVKVSAPRAPAGRVIVTAAMRARLLLAAAANLALLAAPARADDTGLVTDSMAQRVWRTRDFAGG
jgi:hypothetical protein